MTTTYLTRSQALSFFGVPDPMFDIMLTAPEIRRIGDRVHREDIKMAVEQVFEYDEAEEPDWIVASNDNAGHENEAKVADYDEEGGIKLTLWSF